MWEKMEITMFTLWRHVQRSWIMMIQKSKFIAKYENTTTSIYNIHTLLFQLLIVYLWTFIHSWMDFHKICIFNIAKVFFMDPKIVTLYFAWYFVPYHLLFYKMWMFLFHTFTNFFDVVHIKLCCCTLTIRILHFEK